MACVKPLKGWRQPDGGFSFKSRGIGQLMRVPCGRCRGCRYDKSKEWALRCRHESLSHQASCFLTLTYDPDKRDRQNPYTLHPKHVSKFIQDTRNRFRPKKLKYFYSGEYGEEGPGHHPHYHMILFGEDFAEDRTEARELGGKLFKSETLSELWPFGFSSIGDVSLNSAAYVASYTTKKVSGERAAEYYSCVCPESGEVLQLRPEYARMSKGIGKEFVRKNAESIYEYDEVIFNEKPILPPRFYDKVLQQQDEKAYEEVKKARIRKMAYWSEAMSDERLEAREEIMKKREELKRRTF